MLSWFSGCPGIFSEKLSFFVHNTCHHVPHLTAEQQKSPGSEAGCTKSSSESRLSIRIVTCGIVAESPSLHPPPAPRRASPPPPRAATSSLTFACPVPLLPFHTTTIDVTWRRNFWNCCIMVQTEYNAMGVDGRCCGYRVPDELPCARS